MNIDGGEGLIATAPPPHVHLPRVRSSGIHTRGQLLNPRETIKKTAENRDSRVFVAFNHIAALRGNQTVGSVGTKFSAP